MSKTDPEYIKATVHQGSNTWTLTMNGETHHGSFWHDLKPLNNERPKSRHYRWMMGEILDGRYWIDHDFEIRDAVDDRHWMDDEFKTKTIEEGWTLPPIVPSDTERLYFGKLREAMEPFTKNWLRLIPEKRGRFSGLKYRTYSQPDGNGPTWLSVLRDKRVHQAGLRITRNKMGGTQTWVMMVDPKCYTRYGKWSSSEYEYLYQELKERDFTDLENSGLLTEDNDYSIKH